VLLALAAHQGEEFIIALPIVMLGGAYFLLKWAASGSSTDEDSEASAASAPPTMDIQTRDFALVGAGQEPVEPPDEGKAGHDPAAHDR
jgi:hypothetical protein